MATVTTRWRFNPQVLVFCLSMGVAFLPIREAIASWTFASNSYRQLDFVIGEVVANDAYPFARGTLEPGGEEWVLQVASEAGRHVVAGTALVAEPGGRIRVWWSDSAAVIGFGEGRSTKIMPVAAMARPPGFFAALAWSLLGLVAILAGLGATGWTAARWARDTLRTH